MIPILRIIFDRKKKSNQTTPGLVQIEVYYKGKRKFISTGVKVLPSEWDSENKIVLGSNSDFNNNYLIGNMKKRIEEHIIDISRKGEEFSFTILDNVISGNIYSDMSFHRYVLERITKRKIKESTSNKLMTLYNHIERFGKFKRFSDLSAQNIKLFDEYLYENNISKTSIYERHKQLKSFINEAVSDGFLKQSPYLGLKFQKGKPEVRKFLNSDELKLIEDAEIELVHIKKARDLFILCCYTGLAYADLNKFDFKKTTKIGEEYFIEDTRQKTDEAFHILILPKALEVLQKYDFKIPKISNQKYNDYLKIVAGLAKVNKNITTHMARHTFATTILLENDVPIEVVQKLMGHSSIRTTQIYAKLSQKVADKNMLRLKRGINKKDSS